MAKRRGISQRLVFPRGPRLGYRFWIMVLFFVGAGSKANFFLATVRPSTPVATDIITCLYATTLWSEHRDL
ncbi:hypothetical protein B0H17DRAFT_1039704 [Mycena rosella]|uniref:Uncharacterized protein n=1 Tax=Mycena rosella TaxID=1033263 RepID=A0AAD7GSW9_MYCRO|nr:hypothetical protein B0H17DRAFT_1039704 [Mycena rosella]